MIQEQHDYTNLLDRVTVCVMTYLVLVFLRLVCSELFIFMCRLGDKICDQRCKSEDCAYDVGDCGVDLVLDNFPGELL